MNPAAHDIADYIRQKLPAIDAFDTVRSLNKEKGVLVEQNANPTVDTFINLETTALTITIRDNGTGRTGTAKAYEVASAVFAELRLVLDTEINGTLYTRINATTAPWEVWGGADSSIWKFNVEVDRTLEGITWQ